MKTAKLAAILLVLSLLLCGCGGEANKTAERAAGTSNAVMDSASAEVLEKETASSQSAFPTDQKLIRKIWIGAESENMDALIRSVEEQVAQLGGYIEGRQVQNGSTNAAKRYRYGDLTIRIPGEKLDSFVSEVGMRSNITSTRETTDDVTLSYVENESRVIALETEQTRLLELLAKAETMDDILRIEERLTEIRSQLERLKSQLRLYDNLVDYGTVYLTITEVTEYTQVEEPQTMGERIKVGIANSWDDMVEGLGDALVFVIVILPRLLPWAVAAAIAIPLICAFRKKKAKKNPPKEESK